MLTMLKNWKGAVEINGVHYENINDAVKSDLSDFSQIHIVLHSAKKNASQSVTERQSVQSVETVQQYKITVKKYMTQKGSPSFDFMTKWNNDNPMPLRTMIGTVEKETRGMVYMNLHGDIYAEKICTCMKCGRALTNPVSQFFGIGPECGGHNYVNPFSSDAELKAAVSAYKAQLQNIKWSGWIIKSAITEKEEI